MVERRVPARAAAAALCSLLLAGCAPALTGAGLRIVDRPIPFSARRVEMTRAYIRAHYGLDVPDIRIVPKIVVLHWTAVPTLEGSFEAFRPERIPASRTELTGAGEVNVSIHFLVDRDGTVYRLMPETWMARHVIGLNYDAIGVENVGGADGREDLTDAQVAANIRLVRYLARKYPTIEYLIGHSEYESFEGHPLWRELDPGYRTGKIDPGKRFMTAVRAGVEGLGLKGPPARTDAVLQRELERLVVGFRGEVGIYVRHLRSGATASVRPDEIFPTASMIKVPLLARLFDRVGAGELSLDTLLVFRDSLRYAESDIAGELRDSATVSLAQLAFLTAGVSDNTAALWIQALDGGGAAVNEWLATRGFAATRVNSRTPGRQPDWEIYGWGQTTPREIADLLVRIRRGQLSTPRASEALYRLLTKNYTGDEALSQLPPYVQAATKEGAVDRSRSQVLLVNAPAGDYVLSILTRNQADSSWVVRNEGWELIRRVSRTVYHHFNPDDPWRPEGAADLVMSAATSCCPRAPTPLPARRPGSR
jgi:beta-lactamase class A